MDSTFVSSIKVWLESLLADQRELQDVVISNESRLAVLEARWETAWKAARDDIGELKHEVDDLKSKLEAQRNILAEDAGIGREREESEEVLPRDNIEPPLATADCEIEAASSSKIPMKQYALEENLYGYVIAVPSRWIFHIMVLLIYYILVLGISVVITMGVVNLWSSSKNDLNDTCKRDGDTWDCRPPGFTALQNFAAFDMNGDGIWSVFESRQAGFLSQFGGLHDVALGTPKFLSMIMPFKPAQQNLFCYLWRLYSYQLQTLNNSERLAMVEASGYLTDAIRSSCADNHDPAHCYTFRICSSGSFSSSSYQAVSAQTSVDQYGEATAGLSEISYSLHGSLLRNLVHPCRIVDPDLCSNVEVGGFLRTIPMWEGLNPEARVNECEDYVRHSCPRLFGNEYSRFQLALRQTCGAASYSPGDSDVPPPLDSFILLSNPTCKDNHTLAQLFSRGMVRANPSMYFLFTGVERQANLPEGYLTSNLTCDMGVSLGFCSDTAGVVNPDDNLSFVSIASLFGQACPMTCCQLNSYACPSPCAAWNEKKDTSFGSLTCIGLSCSEIEFEERSAAFTLLREGGYGREAARLIIRSELSLQMYIISMNVGSDLDPLCSYGYVELDKVRYCSGNAPERVQIPRRVGGVVELEWLSDVACAQPECGWHLLIVEAGEPESYAVSVVSYENVNKFYDSQTGVVTWIYRVFFTLVLFIWTGYIMMEAKEAYLYFDYVRFHPDFPQRVRFAALVGVCLPRMAIALWVFVVGVVLLITSTSYVDIVLNGVALAFILDIDEYLFAIALSSQDKQKVSDADIVKWPCSVHTYALTRKYGALKVYACLALAVILTTIQYSWNFGYNLESVGFLCACALSGDTCFDAVLSGFFY